MRLAVTAPTYPMSVPVYTETTLPNLFLPDPTTQILLLSEVQSMLLPPIKKP